MNGLCVIALVAVESLAPLVVIVAVAVVVVVARATGELSGLHPPKNAAAVSLIEERISRLDLDLQLGLQKLARNWIART